MTDIWSYRDTARTETTDVVGFEVVATDGSIGKVDEATYDAGPATWWSTPARGSSARSGCCPPG
jgi:hypothetical protein